MVYPQKFNLFTYMYMYAHMYVPVYLFLPIRLKSEVVSFVSYKLLLPFI